jgi:hypothetical protein
MTLKSFEPFTRLDAADLNSNNEFLQDQTVQPFADSAARGSAIATPTDGQLAYLQDANQVTAYIDSGWFPIAGQMPLAVFSRTTNQSIANNNSVSTKITYPTETVLRGGITHSSGEFTLPFSGTYLVSLRVAFATNTTGRRLESIELNGNAILVDNKTAPSSGAAQATISGIVYASATDVIQTNALQNSGGSLDITAANLSIAYLGA